MVNHLKLPTIWRTISGRIFVDL